MIAIATWESGHGTSTAVTQDNNPFGIMTPGTQTLHPFNDPMSAITEEVQTIEAQIAKGNSTDALMFSGQKGAYCVGLNCTSEGSSISNWMSIMGGSSTNLAYPSKLQGISCGPN